MQCDRVYVERCRGHAASDPNAYSLLRFKMKLLLSQFFGSSHSYRWHPYPPPTKKKLYFIREKCIYYYNPFNGQTVNEGSTISYPTEVLERYHLQPPVFPHNYLIKSTHFPEFGGKKSDLLLTRINKYFQR